MRRFDTVIFDLDGTLLYTLTDLHLALNHTLERYGFPPRTLEETRAFVGSGARKLLERAVPEGTEPPDAMYGDFVAWYGLHARDNASVYPGVPELLAELRRRGVAAGVVSNKPHDAAADMIEAFFGGLVAVTEGKKEGRPVKPSPESLRDAMATLGAVRERTLYVGDSEVDADTAKNTGVACVLVSWGFRERDRLEKCGAMAVIDAPLELLGFLGDD